MGFFAFLILGLIAGALAKLILPGRQRGGWLLTMLVGVVGAVLGGWIGTMIFGVGIEAFWDLSTWLLSIGGAVVVLVLYSLIFGRDDKVND